jgi:hypothetical protein
LALALLMATLSDWFVICQRRVPVVLRLGVSMPAVTMRLSITKQDMRKGRKTGWPVSVVYSDVISWRLKEEEEEEEEEEVEEVVGAWAQTRM